MFKNNSAQHMNAANGALSICAVTLYHDLQDSYQAKARPELVGVSRDRTEKRLNQMLDQYRKAAERFTSLGTQVSSAAKASPPTAFFAGQASATSSPASPSSGEPGTVTLLPEQIPLIKSDPTGSVGPAGLRGQGAIGAPGDGGGAATASPTNLKRRSPSPSPKGH